MITSAIAKTSQTMTMWARAHRRWQPTSRFFSQSQGRTLSKRGRGARLRHTRIWQNEPKICLHFQAGPAIRNRELITTGIVKSQSGQMRYEIENSVMTAIGSSAAIALAWGEERVREARRAADRKGGAPPRSE
jgi:hypothetical protein